MQRCPKLAWKCSNWTLSGQLWNRYTIIQYPSKPVDHMFMCMIMGPTSWTQNHVHEQVIHILVVNNQNRGLMCMHPSSCKQLSAQPKGLRGGAMHIEPTLKALGAGSWPPEQQSCSGWRSCSSNKWRQPKKCMSIIQQLGVLTPIFNIWALPKLLKIRR